MFLERPVGQLLACFVVGSRLLFFQRLRWRAADRAFCAYIRDTPIARKVLIQLVHLRRHGRTCQKTPGVRLGHGGACGSAGSRATGRWLRRFSSVDLVGRHEVVGDLYKIARKVHSDAGKVLGGVDVLIDALDEVARRVERSNEALGSRVETSTASLDAAHQNGVVVLRMGHAMRLRAETT